MSPFVLDASITLSWCFADEGTAYTHGVLDALLSTYAVVPALWPFEIASALGMAERRHRITSHGAAEFVALLRNQPIRIERREAAWLWQALLPLARDYGLSAYDAAYLDLAKRDGLPLATLDDQLAAAARSLGVSRLEV